MQWRLCKPASEGNEKAIEFLARVIDDQQARALWNMASQGLGKPAAKGNAVAAAAMKRFAAQSAHR